MGKKTPEELPISREVAVVKLSGSQVRWIRRVIAGDPDAEGRDAFVENTAAQAEYGLVVDLVGQTEPRAKLRAAIFQQAKGRTVLAGTDQPVVDVPHARDDRADVDGRQNRACNRVQRLFDTAEITG